MGRTGLISLALAGLVLISIVSANPIGIEESAGACETYKDLAGLDDDELD